MKMIKGRANALANANDERRQVLPLRVIWDGTIYRFEMFRNNYTFIPKPDFEEYKSNAKKDY